MPTETQRPLVLLLSGDARDALKKALEDSGLEVAAPSWLQGITAARQRRPTLLLVSTDLGPKAVSSVVTTFRTATGLHGLPIIVAGVGADRLDQQTGMFRADRYMETPTDPTALARELLELIRTGEFRPRLRHPWIMGAAATVIGIAGAAGITASFFRATSLGRWLEPFRPAIPLVMALGMIVAALASSRRPDGRVPIAQLRGALLLAGLLFAQSPLLGPRGQPVGTAATAGGSLALLAWAARAWLGPWEKERTPRVARAFRILAGVLAAASLVPWFFVT